MNRIAVRIGAALYVCWGLLHFTAAFGVYKLAQTAAGTAIQGRLLQTAFYLAAFAAAAIALAITLNWRNDRLGFWANGVMVEYRRHPLHSFRIDPRVRALVARLAWPDILDCGLISHRTWAHGIDHVH